MTQMWMVGLIVGLAGLYSVWYLMPTAARKRLGRLNRWLASAPACGSCSECGNCAKPPAGNSPPGVAGQALTFHKKP